MAIKSGIWNRSLIGHVALGMFSGIVLLCTVSTVNAQADADTNGQPGSDSADAKSDTAENPPMSAAEIAELKALYESASAEDRTAMRAYYKSFDCELEALLGITAEQAKQTQRASKLADALRKADLNRTPSAVLAARTSIAQPKPYPNAAQASVPLVVSWIRDQVLAGEWAAWGDFMRPLPEVQSQALYTVVLNKLNSGESGLLPEEVLLVGDAAPAELTSAQIRTLSKILHKSAERTGLSELMRAIRTGTKMFGPDVSRRERTRELLARAGLDREAKEFLPTLKEARATGDAEVILMHGRYLQYLADNLAETDETDSERSQAWALYCEAMKLPSASDAVRSDAMQRAITIMRRLPRAMTEPWLSEAFGDLRLAPLAIEKIALDAITLSDEKTERTERAQGIVTLKEAVDILLDTRSAKSDLLRIPLRMLTTAIAEEMERALPRAEKNGEERPRMDRALLFRAIPSTKWMDALEHSLAVRISGASIELATSMGETDRAMQLLRDAVHRTPGDARDLTERFLSQWTTWLKKMSRQKWESYRYSGTTYSWRNSSLPPVTRGIQRRNLQVLRTVLEELSSIGVNPHTLPSIATVFTACHNSAEAFELSDIEQVFGPVDQLSAGTARDLANAISASVNHYWSDRATQSARGSGASGKPATPKKPNAEIIAVVERGFAAALALAQRAETVEPTDWETSQLVAVLAFNRLKFNLASGKVDESKRLKILRDTYAAFEKAAKNYAETLARGSQKEDASVFILWFKTALGTTDMSMLNLDMLPTEGSLQENQFDRIGAALRALPPDVADRHIAQFALALGAAVDGVPPEVKPRFVDAVLRIVGDHPAGASTRVRQRLYRELMADEVKLRLTVDGPDALRVDVPFGVVISLRYTNAVERETEGFSKYLRKNVSIVGANGQSREINYRELLHRSIESAFSRSFDVQQIGFYAPERPSAGVIENGQSGWLEKPMAYLIVSPKDESVDRLPQVSMEMQFYDGGGYSSVVNVVTASNTPRIAVGPGPETRPCHDLAVTQIVDARDAVAAESDRKVCLEVTARGRGVVPELSRLLDGVETALPGYEVQPDGIDAHPLIILDQQEENALAASISEDAGGYIEPDADGLVRPMVERSWVVTYRPTNEASSGRFHLPRLAAGISATLDSKYYAELDIAPAPGEIIELGIGRTPVWPLVFGGLMVVLVIGLIAYARQRRRVPATSEPMLARPERITPLSVVTTLRRWHTAVPSQFSPSDLDALATDINELEQTNFGPNARESNPEILKKALDGWASKTSSVVDMSYHK